MEAVILFRNARGGVQFMSDEGGEDMAVFSDRDEAIGTAEEHPYISRCLWQVVELDEL